MKKQKKYAAMLLGTSLGILSGCVKKIDPDVSRQEKKYVSVEEKEIPEEMKKRIDEKKKEPFEIMWTDREGILYLAKGYGACATTGYRAEAESVTESEDTVFVETCLYGPEKGVAKEDVQSFPYLVILIEDEGKEVVIDG